MNDFIDLPHLPECLLGLPLETIHEIHSHTYHAIKADRQQRGKLECEVRERGFLYENGKHTPTLLLAFPIEDWDGRDRMADAIAAAPKFGEEQ